MNEFITGGIWVASPVKAEPGDIITTQNKMTYTCCKFSDLSKYRQNHVAKYYEYATIFGTTDDGMYVIWDKFGKCYGIDKIILFDYDIVSVEKPEVKKEELMFQVGDKVYDIRFGEGVVIENTDYDANVIVVEFQEVKNTYYSNGVYFEGENRSLFFAPPVFTDEMLNRPAPKREPYKEGDLVWVSIPGNANEVLRFVERDCGDDIWFFMDGARLGAVVATDHGNVRKYESK